ncbi:MAG: T9SS type A sorting domain-containing protein [Calditrichaeota bacterium]|nr:T9SS type A sorting domain-containing protein [Calditrichota bacterium]
MNSGRQVTANFKHWPQITIATNPTGLQITVDGTSATAPQIFTWQPGTSHTIEAVAEQNDGTTKKYVWTAWSDGGTRNHTIQTPQTDATFTATYKTQFYVQTQASPTAGGTVSPASGWYDANTQLSFKATPTNGYGFLNWSGSWEGDENPKSVTLNSAIDVTANFSQYRQITLHTNPEGLKIKADGNESTAPVTVNWLIGTTHSVDVNSPQNGGSGVRYVWQNWSDGGAQSHSVHVTSTLSTLTANFSKEYYVTVQVSPQDAGTISPSSGWHAENSKVTFTEQANEGYEFLQWSGDASGSQPSVQVVVDGAKTITANYNEWYVVTVRAEKTSATQTVLQIVVDGQTYSSPHTFRAQPNSVHTIEAPEIQSPEGPGRRYQYIDWSDRGARSHQVTISSNNMEFAARYALQFHLSTTVNPESTGTIQTSEEGEWISAWKTVQVEAVAGDGYAFMEWQGDLQGKQNPTSVYMDGPKSIQANFEVAKTLILFKTNPSGLKINVDGAEYQTPVSFNWAVGESHRFEAVTPQVDGDSTRYQFNHWDNHGGQSQTITVGSSSQTFQAYYDTYYNVAATSPQGTVTGAGWYKSGSVATLSVDSLVAVNSQERYLFSGWTGTQVSPNARFIVTVNHPVQERAEFQHQFGITTAVDPSHSGSVEINPSQDWYTEGMDVILHAVADSGYRFLAWDGTISGNQNPISLNVSAPVTATARFQQKILSPVISSFGINRYAVANTDTITLQFTVEDSQTVTPEIQWFRNGVMDTLLADQTHILPSDLNAGDVLYAVFRVSNGTSFSRWHRTPPCPVLPVPPRETRLVHLSGRDTTVVAGDDSSRLLISFKNATQNSGQFTLSEEDTLEKYVTINFLGKSSKFYFNNTLGGYLLINGNLGNYTWSLSFQYSDSQVRQAGIQQEDSLKLGWSDDLGNSWHYLDNAVVDTLNNLIQTSSLTHFSLWALGERPFSQFYPVELSSFAAKVSDEGKVILTWETQTETNNLGFEVQRKAKNSGFFEKVGFVKGAGTSVQPHAYRFEDAPEKPGLFSYRLKQADLNGAVHVSQEINVSVQVPISSVLLRNYPNPFNSSTTIQFSVPKNYENKDATVTIYDIVGKAIISFKFPRIRSGIHEITWDGKDNQHRTVPSGLFFYRLQIGKMRKIQKMILLK